MSEVSELANFLVSSEKNDPSDPRFSQASAELLRLETELKANQRRLDATLAVAENLESRIAKLKVELDARDKHIGKLLLSNSERQQYIAELEAKNAEMSLAMRSYPVIGVSDGMESTETLRAQERDRYARQTRQIAQMKAELAAEKSKSSHGVDWCEG